MQLTDPQVISVMQVTLHFSGLETYKELHVIS